MSEEEALLAELERFSEEADSEVAVMAQALIHIIRRQDLAA